MKAIFNYILWAVLVLKVQLVWTQAVEPDSIILLKEVKVEAFRFTHHQTGLQTTTFDSIQKQNYLHRNVAEILAESPIFIKSYGLGSLATTAFRGGGANQYSRFVERHFTFKPHEWAIRFVFSPCSCCRRIIYSTRSRQCVFGSGAVAGVIHFANKPRFNQGLTIKGDASFGCFC